MILATVAIALGIVVRAGTALIGEPFLTATHTSELYLPLTYAIPLAWLINVVAGCFKSVYGREMVAWSIGMQIRSHSSPDHAGRLSIITVPYGGKGGLIRHSMYDHDAATEAIRRWIAQDFMLWPVETDVMA